MAGGVGGLGGSSGVGIAGIAVGAGGSVEGMGGMGRTRVGVGNGGIAGLADVGNGGIAGRVDVGNGGIAGVVKDIVRSIEAVFWHTHDVGTEEQIVDVVGSEVVGELKQNVMEAHVKRCIDVKISLVIHHR